MVVGAIIGGGAKPKGVGVVMASTTVGGGAVKRDRLSPKKIAIKTHAHSPSKIAPIKTICHPAIRDRARGFGADCWDADCGAG